MLWILVYLDHFDSQAEGEGESEEDEEDGDDDDEVSADTLAILAGSGMERGGREGDPTSVVFTVDDGLLGVGDAAPGVHSIHHGQVLGKLAGAQAVLGFHHAIPYHAIPHHSPTWLVSCTSCTKWLALICPVNSLHQGTRSQYAEDHVHPCH